MEAKHNTVWKNSSLIVNGASVAVYDAGTLNLASIFEQDGTTALANPFLAGYDRGEGEIDFAAANGLYDIEVTNGSEVDTLENVVCNDPNDAFPLTAPIVTTDTTESTSTTTGSGIFAGGVGIAKSLWVGLAANIGGILTAVGAVINGLLTANNGIKHAIFSLTDANEVLSYTGDTRYVGTPTVSRDKTLPSSGVITATRLRFLNFAAFNYVIKSSNGDTIVTFQNGMVELEALQDTPTTSAHWAVRENSTVVAGGLSETVLEIGDWNMDTSPAAVVAHGLTLANIRGVTSVLIRNDADTIYDLLDTGVGTTDGAPQGFVALIDGTNVTLTRITGGTFDHTDYDATTYNRGWIIVKHV